MGCGHLWDDNLIVYGCGKGDPNYWTIDTSDTSALVEGSTSGACGFPAALNFRNIDNSTLIATGNTKNIYQFTSVDGFQKLTGTLTKTVQNHNFGQAFTLPAGTFTCEDGGSEADAA